MLDSADAGAALLSRVIEFMLIRALLVTEK